MVICALQQCRGTVNTVAASNIRGQWEFKLTKGPCFPWNETARTPT